MEEKSRKNGGDEVHFAPKQPEETKYNINIGGDEIVDWTNKIPASVKESGLEKNISTSRFIVELSSRDINQIRSVVMANHGKIIKEFQFISSVVIEIPCSALPAVARLKEVKKIKEDIHINTLERR